MSLDVKDFARAGYTVLEAAHAGSRGAAVASSLADLFGDSVSAPRRVPADSAVIDTVLGQPEIRHIVRRLVGKRARPVRAIAFDKTARRNWAVPWHQDRTIAVDRRDDRADACCWTVKNGVTHCEPPVGLLERMLTLRWHLDAVGPEDGCIRVVPGSHRMGRLAASDIAHLLATEPVVDVPVTAGSVLLMSPLLVHSSRKRTTEGRRRVLHVELAAGEPPAPLNWAWA